VPRAAHVTRARGGAVESRTEVTAAYGPPNPRRTLEDEQQIFERKFKGFKAPASPDELYTERDVKVDDVRDFNAIMKLQNPMQPTEELQLIAITTHDGIRTEWPQLSDLKGLKISDRTPVMFSWRDRQRVQTKAPKEYDDIIQRLLNSGPEEMQDLVRSNWQQFDQGFFFRLTELKEDTRDERLIQKIEGLERLALNVVNAAKQQSDQAMPEQSKEVQEIFNTFMTEDDQGTMLWPPKPETMRKMSETVEKFAVRHKYTDVWYETMVELVERFAKKMQARQDQQMLGMGQSVMQRLITSWLRHDELWEETSEGKFLSKLMTLSHEQWPQALQVHQEPLEVSKLKDELKIIMETKVIKLPVSSQLQVYASKYLQGLVDFVEAKDRIVAQAGTDGPVAQQVG